MMKKKNVFLLVTILFVLSFCWNLSASETVVVKSGTPLFAQPLKKVIYVQKKQREFSYKRKFLLKNEKFPLMKCVWFYEVFITPDFKRTAYVAPALEVKISDKLINGRKRALIDRRSEFNWNFAVPAIICLLTLIYFIYFHLIRKEYKTEVSLLVFCVFLFFLRCAMLASVQGYPISIFCIATDEHYYFKGAIDIVNNDIFNIKEVSVGTPLYYVPFYLLFGNHDIYSVLLPISKFNGFVLMPIVSIMLFFIAIKFTGSYRKSIIYVLLFSAMALFYHRYETWSDFLFKARFALPDVDGYRLYKQYLNSGFNNLPDVPSFFILALMVLYSLFGKKNIVSIIVVSCLFGLACLVRLNNIMLAPLVAMLFWFKYKNDFYDYKKLVLYALVSIFSFLAVMSVQFVVNYMNYGAVLASPYGDPENPISNVGFICQAITTMIGCTYLFMVVGVAGLIFQTNRKNRIILVLWTIPMILFFSTTRCVSVAPNRYLIFVIPGLLLSFFALSLWQKANKIELTALIISLVFTFIFVSPAGMAPFSGVLPLDLQLFDAGKSIAVFLYVAALLIDVLALFFVRKNKSIFYFLLFTLAVFFIGSSFVIITVFVLIMLRTLVDIFYELLPSCKHFYAQISGKKNISC